MLDMRVRASYLASLQGVDPDLASTFAAAEKVGHPQVVHLILEPEPYARAALGDKVREAVKALLRRSDLRENALSLSVSGWRDPFSAVEKVDLLKDQLISPRKIVKMDRRSRILNDASAYRAIEDAYRDLKSELEAAAALE